MQQATPSAGRHGDFQQLDLGDSRGSGSRGLTAWSDLSESIAGIAPAARRGSGLAAAGELGLFLFGGATESGA